MKLDHAQLYIHTLLTVMKNTDPMRVCRSDPTFIKDWDTTPFPTTTTIANWLYATSSSDYLAKFGEATTKRVLIEYMAKNSIKDYRYTSDIYMALATMYSYNRKSATERLQMTYQLKRHGCTVQRRNNSYFCIKLDIKRFMSLCANSDTGKFTFAKHGLFLNLLTKVFSYILKRCLPQSSTTDEWQKVIITPIEEHHGKKRSRKDWSCAKIIDIEDIQDVLLLRKHPPCFHKALIPLGNNNNDEDEDDDEFFTLNYDYRFFTVTYMSHVLGINKTKIMQLYEPYLHNRYKREKDREKIIQTRKDILHLVNNCVQTTTGINYSSPSCSKLRCKGMCPAPKGRNCVGEDLSKFGRLKLAHPSRYPTALLSK